MVPNHPHCIISKSNEDWVNWSIWWIEYLYQNFLVCWHQKMWNWNMPVLMVKKKNKLFSSQWVNSSKAIWVPTMVGQFSKFSFIRQEEPVVTKKSRIVTRQDTAISFLPLEIFVSSLWNLFSPKIYQWLEILQIAIFPSSLSFTNPSTIFYSIIVRPYLLEIYGLRSRQPVQEQI